MKKLLALLTVAVLLFTLNTALAVVSLDLSEMTDDELNALALDVAAEQEARGITGDVSFDSSVDVQTKYEGDGYNTPEEAAEAYLIALKNQDIQGMIATFAIESYVDNYDFKAFVERLRSYVFTFVVKLPNSNEYNKALNIESRRADIALGILYQFMFFNASDELNDGRAMTFQNDSDEILAFVLKFALDTRLYKFDDLVITGAVAPETISERYLDERNQKNLETQVKPFGVTLDDVENVVICFTADGSDWYFCPQLIRYNGRWYMQSLLGNLAMLMGMDKFSGGTIQVDDIDQ